MSSNNSNTNRAPYCHESDHITDRTQIEETMYQITVPEIRMPHSLPSGNSRMVSSTCDRSEVQDSCDGRPVTTQSTLNPYAEAFVPNNNFRREIMSESLGSGECNTNFHNNYYSSSDEGNSSSTSSSSVSNRLKVYRPNITTTEEYEDYMRSNKVQPMEKLNQAIDTLRQDLDNFNRIQAPILELADDVSGDKEFLEVAIRLLLNETIRTDNFCYNGARLCVLFCKKIPTFHEMIVQQCNRYMETYTDRCDRTIRDYNFLRGLLSSMSELFFQFITEQGLNLRALTVFSHTIMNAMFAMVKIDIDQDLNIKAVCQALKLAGFYLQRCDESRMAALLSLLETEVENGSENMKARVRNIRYLSTTDWGYTSDIDDTAENRGSANSPLLAENWEDSNYNGECNDIDDTVYYGPDGKVLTAEETSFLYFNCGDSETDTINVCEDDEDTLWDPENELGPEMQKAFKEFIQYSKNNY